MKENMRDYVIDDIQISSYGAKEGKYNQKTIQSIRDCDQMLKFKEGRKTKRDRAEGMEFKC